MGQLKPTMHSLVQSYDDPAEENRHVFDYIGLTETPHPGTTVCVMKQWCSIVAILYSCII